MFGAPIHEGYGLTETSPTVSFNYVGRTPRPGTVGQPNWGVDVEIADAENDDAIELLPHGELGEIVVRGYNLFAGYLGRPDATEATFTDGWFRTGDLGTKDDDDYITIVDRKKDMIVRNGYNVYPNEVEQVLLRHPGVVNAAVFGVAHETHGQEIHAAVIPHDADVDTDELDRVRPRPHRRLQVPAGRAPRRRAATGSLRQGAEARARRAVPARSDGLIRASQGWGSVASRMPPRAVAALRRAPARPDASDSQRIPTPLRSVRSPARGSAHPLAG